MKKPILSVIIIFLLTSNIQAQIVLNPPDAAGGVKKNIQSVSGFWYVDTTCYCYPDWSTFNSQDIDTWVMGSMRVYHTMSDYFRTNYSFLSCPTGALCGPDYMRFWSYGVYLNFDSQAIIEFDISSLTGMGVTVENFKAAFLNNLLVIESIHTHSPMTLCIHDLHDSSEDGLVSSSDHSNFVSPALVTLFDQVPLPGTCYDNIDVTDDIYNDLFGPGNTEEYSGFLLKSDPTSGPFPNPSVNFDCDLPSLTIVIEEPQVPSLSLWGILFLGSLFSIYAILRLRKTSSQRKS